MSMKAISDTSRASEQGSRCGVPPDADMLAEQAIAALETLADALDEPAPHWLRTMIDVLRVYRESLEDVPGGLVLAPTSSGLILRRGLQSFALAEDEFDMVRTAFRRCSRYRKKRGLRLAKHQATIT